MPFADLPPDVELHAWLEVGLAIVAEESSSASIDMARVQIKRESLTYGGMFQTEAATGSLELLDAVVWFRPIEPLTIRAGHFKTPLSLDFLTPAPKMLLPTRPMLVSAVPRRESGLEVALESEAAVLRLGVYDSNPALAETGAGVRPVVAAEVALPGHLELHTGATTWLHGEAPAGELPERDHAVDIGLEYEHHHVIVTTEGLIAHNIAADDIEPGCAVMAAVELSAGHLELEPVVGWDAMVVEGEATSRGSAALNVHRDGWQAVASLSVEAILPDGEQVARAQLQTGF